MKRFFRDIFVLARLRFLLLLRQKLGWISLLAGLGIVILGFVTADVSYISREKIFWDFALAASFILQMLLACYLGSQILTEEKGRRTLHLLLAAGASRAAWIWGNILGLWLALVVIDGAWFVLSSAISYLQFGEWTRLLLLQAKFLQVFEVLLVLSLSFFASLWMRSLVALFASVVMVLFLHSVDSIERIFVDSETAHMIEATWAAKVTQFAHYLPPLNWMDLKDLVGYQSELAAPQFWGVWALGCVWTLILLAGSSLRFERMDL